MVGYIATFQQGWHSGESTRLSPIIGEFGVSVFVEDGKPENLEKNPRS